MLKNKDFFLDKHQLHLIYVKVGLRFEVYDVLNSLQISRINTSGKHVHGVGNQIIMNKNNMLRKIRFDL